MVTTQQIGSWAFILGVVIAIIAGAVISYDPVLLGGKAGTDLVLLVLVVLGLVVGLINVGDQEITDFLIAGIALLAIGVIGAPFGTQLQSGGISVISIVGPYISSIVTAITVFVAPAVLVTALKAVYNLARQPTVPE